MTNSDRVHLQSSGLTAEIDPLGAQMKSLATTGGLQLLWHGDPSYWPEHAPILFPLIGPLVDNKLRHRGQTYEMPPHGFAQKQHFTISQRNENHCLFVTQDTPETRAIYPFSFQLEVEYTLQDHTLLNTIRVTNTSDEPLPADIGFHPGFQWPLEPGRPKEEYRIVFERDEPAPIRRGPGDPIFLYPDPQPSPIDGNVLHLRDELFDAQAMVLDQPQSRSVTYGADTGPRIRVEFPDSPQLAVWMRPGATFIAIEPWQGLPAPVGYDGPFINKPAIAVIEPGETNAWRMNVTLE